MSFSSKVLYEGDGIQTNYNVPMPYIAQGHINVYLNGVLQLATMHYTWVDTSTISFVNAPGDGDAIEFKRWTSPTSTLVDYVDGSTLRANDLDTGYLHNFYLSQEYADSFNEVINAALLNVASGQGIVEVESDAVIAALVNEMIATEAASTLQARISDIDLNAEAIVTLGESLQVQLNTLAQGVAAAVYIQPTEPVPGVGGIPNPIPEGARWYDSDDNNAAYIYTSSVWVDINDPRIGNNAAAISVLQVDTADNAAAIVNEALVRSNADSATASTLALIGAENVGGTAFIIDLTTAYVGPAESLGSRFTTLSAATTAAQADADTNAADIITEQTARTNADSAIASDVTALDARVTTAEGDIITNAAAVSSLTTSVSNNAGNISANAANITTLQTDVDLRASTFMQATQPTANNVGDLWVDTDTNIIYRWNGTLWVSTQDAAIAGNAAAISSLTTDVQSNATGISTNASDISSVQTDITTLQGSVTTAQADISTNASSIAGNAGDISSNATAITGVQATLSERNRVFHQGTVPTADNIGDLWIDTSDNNNLHVWNGTIWSPSDNAAMAANASAITTLDSTVTSQGGLISANASAITVVESDILTVDGRVDTANITISANTSAISSNDGDISTLYAKYGVSLDVNGYITGFAQNNDGQTGSFVVLADKFAVVTPSTTWSFSTTYSVGDTIRPTTANSRVYECTTAGTSGGTEPVWTTTIGLTNADNTVVWTCRDDATLQPFIISGNNIVMNGNVEINGSLLLNGTVVGSALVAGTIGTTQIGTNAITSDQINANAVTAVKILAGAITAEKINVTNLSAVSADLGTITAGTITMDTAGYIRGGQTAYNTGTGFYLGYSGGAYKFSIGNGSDFLTWDGTTLGVKGNIILGTWVYSTTLQNDMAVEDTSNSAGYLVTSAAYKKVTMDRDGTMGYRVSGYYTSSAGAIDFSDTEDPDYWIVKPRVEIWKNGVFHLGRDFDTVYGSYVLASQSSIGSFVAGDYFELKVTGGRFFDTSAQTNRNCTMYGGKFQLRGDVNITGNDINLDS